MTDTLRRYEDLLRAIAELPALPAGHVRVFRGQTRDYAEILPSGLRRSLAREAIWHAYSMRLYADLRPESGPGYPLTPESVLVHGLWLDAVSQHYGPGSMFLDVTHSLEVALWFALHAVQISEVESVVSGGADYLDDHPKQTELIQYVPWEEDGYLYVWDLPLWDGQTMPEPGVVVDLALAPETISESPRIGAQQGCLVYCGDNRESALDLRAMQVAGSPFRVARPITGSSALARRVRDLFPSPAVDEWYDRFLSVPLTYSSFEQPPRLERTINVLAFDDPDDPEYSHEVVARENSLAVPLLHRLIGEDPRPLTIVLEAPLVFSYPTGDSPQWQDSLLATDIPESCMAYELDPSLPPQEVSLNDILFEISPLEYPGWERARHRANLLIYRGIWLRRDKNGWYVCFVLLSRQNHNETIETTGLLPIRIDQDTGRWVFGRHDQSTGGTPVGKEPMMGKFLYLALMLLRYLEPTPKAEAFPAFESSDGESRRMVVNVTGEAAQLYRVRSPVQDWFVLRPKGNTAEPFTHASEYLGSIEFTAKGQYRDLKVDAISDAIASGNMKEPATSASEYLSGQKGQGP